MAEYLHVNFLWDDAAAPSRPRRTVLVYRSNLLGSDQRITNTGGGNTSSKIIEKHPLTGEALDVLWVKGSGGDLRTSKRANFAALEMKKFKALEPMYQNAAEKGVKSPIEDKMVSMYPHCTFSLNPTASSIDTPLHGFLPARHVDHMHPNALIAVAASKNAEKLTKEIFGDELVHVPGSRPGFDLGLRHAAKSRRPPPKPAASSWVSTASSTGPMTTTPATPSPSTSSKKRPVSSNRKTRAKKPSAAKSTPRLPDDRRDELLVDILPWLRGQVSQGGRGFIATVESTPAVLRFVNSIDAPALAELGTSCPDHFLRTKIKPLYVPWNPATGDLASLKGNARAKSRQVPR